MFSRPEDITVSTNTLIKIVLFAVALFFLWTVRDVLILLLISITFASALEPMVDALNQRKVPRAASVLAVYILAIGLVALLASVIVPPVISQFQQLGRGNELAVTISDRVGTSEFLKSLHLNELVAKNAQAITQQITSLSDNFFQKTLGVFNGVVQIITILVVSFYLLAEKNGMKNFVYTLVPKEYEAKVLHLVNKSQRKIGFWLLGQLILSAVIFALTLIVLTVLGVKYALALAILAGFFEIIPYLGPIISAIPAVVFAFLQSPTLALAVLVSYILIQKFESYVLVPKVMEKTTGLSPLVILVAILIGFKLAGVFGILLAVPIVSTINVIFSEWGNLKDIKPAPEH